VQADSTQLVTCATVLPAPPRPGPLKPPAPPSRKNLSWPVATSCLTRASVGSGTEPLNPPIGMTSCPVARMYAEASDQDETASRYPAPSRCALTYR
jgi:hypothetical protein